MIERRLSILLLTLGAAWATATADDDPETLALIEPISSARPVTPGPENVAGILRAREARVRLAVLPDAGRLPLELFDDVTHVALLDRLERRSASAYTWIGRLEGLPESQVLLAVEDGHLAGTIWTPERIFRIRAASADTYHVEELADAAFPPRDPPLRPGPPGGTPAGDVPDDGSTIDVLVVYTPAAAGSGLAAEIRLAIDETNAALAASGLAWRLRLVGTALVQATETGLTTTDLEQVTSGAGLYSRVAEWREAACADLVSLWTRTGEICGRAWILGGLSPQFAPYGYSVVRRDCGSQTFAHEIGHNLGACHDRYETTCQGLYDDSHGHVDTIRRWRTIMSYPDLCEDQGLTCNRIPRFSNPQVNWNGSPTGVAAPSPASADNARTLAATALTVANFQPRSANDLDDDSWCAGADNCPLLANADQANADGDVLGNACDNCPATSNADQRDFDADGRGDVCETGATLADADRSGRVDGFDLARLGRATGSHRGEARYDPTVDLDRNDLIDGQDLAVLALSFGVSGGP